MAIPADSPQPVAVLRGLGLTPALSADGQTFTLRGLGALPVERADEVRAFCRARRDDILRELAPATPAPQARTGRAEADKADKARDDRGWNARDFWPLNRRYTSLEQVRQVLRAWRLELEVDEDDFRLSRTQKPELHPQLMVFFRANAPLINRLLREGTPHA